MGKSTPWIREETSSSTTNNTSTTLSGSSGGDGKDVTREAMEPMPYVPVLDSPHLSLKLPSEVTSVETNGSAKNDTSFMSVNPSGGSVIRSAGKRHTINRLQSQTRMSYSSASVLTDTFNAVSPSGRGRALGTRRLPLIRL